MKKENIKFIKISLKDSDIIDKLSKTIIFKSYLKTHKEIALDFAGLLENKKTRFSYWVERSEDKPSTLIITEDLSKSQPDYMTPWIEPDRKTLWVDFIFLGKEALPEDGALRLAAFAVDLPKEVGALLADPEVKEEIILTLYELAGFTKVSTFIRGQGFFKGTSHYLMKLKI